MGRSMLMFGVTMMLVSLATAQEKDERPFGPPPIIQVVSLNEDGAIEKQVMRYETRTIRVERLIEDGGARRAVVEDRTVVVPVMELQRIPATDVKAFDIDGNEIKLKDVADRLSRPTPVLIAPGGKIDSRYRDLFQMGTLVLALSEVSAPPAVPIPRGIPMPAPTPAPR